MIKHLLVFKGIGSVLVVQMWLYCLKSALQVRWLSRLPHWSNGAKSQGVRTVKVVYCRLLHIRTALQLLNVIPVTPRLILPPLGNASDLCVLLAVCLMAMDVI